LLTFVPTPIGNLEDISKRALTALGSAELILCEDTRVTKKLLLLLSEKYQLDFPCTQFKSYHSYNEQQVLNTLDKELFNQHIVYVSDAGMPCISDPGASLVDYAIKNDITYDVIPGANAVLTAFAMSGFDYTEFTFYGFLDHKGKGRSQKLAQVMQSNHLGILYESPHRLLKTLQEIAQIDPQRVLFLAKELTKKFQTGYKDSAQNLAQKFKTQNIKGEWVIIIEPTVFKGETLDISDIEDLDIAPKIKAKLLAKMQGRKVKEIYQELLDRI
jgi:16S rRNA (cytidine1402-2'-O)-methyltransferase